MEDVCGLHRPQQGLSQRHLPIFEHRSAHRQHNRIRAIQLSRCVLRVQLDTNVPPNHEKTTFMTEGENYCFKVMPFSLKNLGATYQ